MCAPTNQILLATLPGNSNLRAYPSCESPYTILHTMSAQEETEKGDGSIDSEPQAKRLKLSAKDTDTSSIEKKQCVPLEEGSLTDVCLEEGSNKELKDGVCGSCDPACEDKVEISAPTSSTAVYLKEEDVGITEYISSHSGFFAILKQRFYFTALKTIHSPLLSDRSLGTSLTYSDFMVHELALDGSVVRLSSLSLPDDSDNSQGTKVSLETVFSAEDVNKLQKLSESLDKAEHVDIRAGGDKDQRTLVHRAIREHFPALESKTVDGAGEEGRIIQVTYSGEKKGPRRSWPRGRGDYCKFVLYKENKDTMEAVGLLAKILKTKPLCFQYAGTKDRRAITSQNVTTFRVSAERLLGLNSSCRNMKLGNFEYVSDHMKLGSLSGNKFTIVLRSVSCDDRMIQEAMCSLRDAGFINYFGMQRFGTSTVPTYNVGRCLLRSDWQGAIDLILKPRPGETEELSSARQYYWETRDIAGTLARFPKTRNLETQLLLGLQKRGPKNDLLGALNFIPRNARLMYVHSYQSLLWNKMASWRIKESGLTPIVGDLVWTAADNRSRSCVDKEKENRVKYVTEETVAQYSIHNVVLPLPGYDVLYPRNKVGEQYHRLLEEDGFSVEHLRHRVKDFSLPGSYRSLVVKPADVTWEVLHYNDVTIPLTLSDIDSLEHKPHPQSVPNGKLKALKLEFSLPPSTYATMAIREVLKTDTSSHHQAQLNPIDNSVDKNTI